MFKPSVEFSLTRENPARPGGVLFAEALAAIRYPLEGRQPGVYHGHEGVRSYWRNWLSAWSDLDFEIQDVVDGGDEVVLLIRNQQQWGRHSGIATDIPPYGMVFTIGGGKVVRWRAYPNQESALEAAGLQE